jgi:DNA helicase-4
VSETFNQRYREVFKCNQCTNGYYKLKQGKYGNFYSCTSGASCKSKPRICEKCGAPSIDYAKESICQNPNCHNSIKICDRCGRPIKRRNGRFGEFWGCTGYGIPGDQCKNTWKI